MTRDHGPVDVSLVVGGQSLVVADGAAVAGDPRHGALHDPPAGQDLEGVQVIGRLTISSVSFGLSLVRAQVTSLPA
jgi:hypothetical protein